jgi:hypothetical protein
MGVFAFGVGLYALGRSGGGAAECHERLTHCKLDLIAAQQGVPTGGDARLSVVTQA